MADIVKHKQHVVQCLSRGTETAAPTLFCVKLNWPRWYWQRFKNMIKFLLKRGERGSGAVWINEYCAKISMHEHFCWPSAGAICLVAGHPLPCGSGWRVQLILVVKWESSPRNKFLKFKVLLFHTLPLQENGRFFCGTYKHSNSKFFRFFTELQIWAESALSSFMYSIWLIESSKYNTSFIFIS